MTVKRTSQVAAEILSAVDPLLRASQVAAEILSAVDPKLRASQVVVEILSENVPDDPGPGGGQTAHQIIIGM